MVCSRIKNFSKHSSNQELTHREIKFRKFLHNKDCWSLKRLKKKSMLTKNEINIYNDFISIADNENFIQQCSFLSPHEENLLKPSDA